MLEVELNGLDGGNLLGFLSALGTFRVLSAAAAEVRMHWQRKGGWMPVIGCVAISGEDELLDLLERGVCGDHSVNEAWNIGNDLTLTKEEYAGVLVKHSDSERSTLDFLAAFGSEAVGSGPKKEQMTDTEFRTMSGAGHQHFLGFMRDLAKETGRDHLRRCLFETWDYSDGRPSLRWDPADYRPHALRAEDPSGDPIKTMRGANRLAVEALPLFPTVPTGRSVRTVGFNDRDATEVSWPLWSDGLELASVAALLASGEAQEPNRHVASRRGVVQIMRAKRFTEGKYRNFSPAIEML
jgi:hypothetical protein